MRSVNKPREKRQKEKFFTPQKKFKPSPSKCQRINARKDMLHKRCRCQFLLYLYRFVSARKQSEGIVAQVCSRQAYSLIGAQLLWRGTYAMLYLTNLPQPPEVQVERQGRCGWHPALQSPPSVGFTWVAGSANDWAKFKPLFLVTIPLFLFLAIIS